MKTAADILKEKNKDIVSISFDQTIHQAARIMIERKKTFCATLPIRDLIPKLPRSAII
jgi:hypothetical protein